VLLGIVQRIRAIEMALAFWEIAGHDQCGAKQAMRDHERDDPAVLPCQR